MTYWTKRRYASLAVHTVIAIGLLAWSLTSSLHFWQWAFKDEVYAYGSVIFLDGLALLGFVLYIFRVQSPLVHVRHLLPVVSAVPLVFDMHRQFEHLQDGKLVWGLTLGVTALLVWLAWVVWRTIERMFVSPVEAAREYASEQMEGLHVRSAQMQVMHQATQEFVQAHQPLLQAPPAQVYPRPSDAPAVVQVSTTRLDDAPGVVHDASADMHPMHGQMHDAPPLVHPDASPVEADAFATDFTHSATHYRCIRCSAVNETPIGKDSSKQRGSSSRWGCPNCKGALPV